MWSRASRPAELAIHLNHDKGTLVARYGRQDAALHGRRDACRYNFVCMSSKSNRIEELIQRFQGGPIDAYFLGYIECFNRQLYFEAHEVLEQLWLPQRSGPDGDFYKGLIQLAGAFVH